ncbi:MAG: hydroxymethylglutaryl-CoA lyase [Elusimicrobia bacterium]|nr:hydroxymethylglutaryl-CoA lyase [Elusimicrobiota bacterium]
MLKRPRLRFVEVGPRDGLQNEALAIPLEDKLAFVQALAETGVGEVEAGAFVSPAAVPQMADSEMLFRRLWRKTGVVYSALVPNEKGLDRALECKVQKIAVFTAASETFNRRNINASIAESLERFRPVAARAKAAGLPVRGYVSTAFHCPYDGPVAPAAAVGVCRDLLALGVDELSVGDTIGRAAPREVRALLAELLKTVPVDKVFLHFHDTYGMAVANALTAWSEFGVSGFDASAGGLGGCPYAPGAGGNAATEDLAFAFAAEGGETGLDLDKVRAAALALEPRLGHPIGSKLCRVRPGRTVAER